MLDGQTKPTKPIELRPFHKTIAAAVRGANVRELKCLAGLIATTMITEGHDEIIEAWTQRMQRMQGSDFLWVLNCNAVASLLAQKQTIETERTTDLVAGKEHALSTVVTDLAIAVANLHPDRPLPHEILVRLSELLRTIRAILDAKTQTELLAASAEIDLPVSEAC